jgi:hypothetical protein
MPTQEDKQIAVSGWTAEQCIQQLQNLDDEVAYLNNGLKTVKARKAYFKDRLDNMKAAGLWP